MNLKPLLTKIQSLWQHLFGGLTKRWSEAKETPKKPFDRACPELVEESSHDPTRQRQRTARGETDGGGRGRAVIRSDLRASSGLSVFFWLIVIAFKRLLGLLRSPFSRSGRKHGRRKRDKPCFLSRRKPDWVSEEIIRIAAFNAGCRTIAAIFNRLHAFRRKVTVGKTYVACVTRQHRYDIEALRKRFHHRVPPPMPNNIAWGIDLTGKESENGALNQILGILDHGSRRILCLRGIASKNSWALLGHLCFAIGDFGKPKAVRTDNEACFTSRAFRIGLGLLGIRHQRSDLGAPWQNGRIERFFGTLKEKLDQWSVNDSGELNRALEIFAEWYNAVRPHAHLGRRTPLEQWNKIDPFRKAPKSVAWFCAWDGLLTGYRIRF